MKISGERVIAAPVSVVWASLFDPAVLQASIPGCESVAQVSDDRYEAVTVVAIGPLKARFSGALTITDVDAPARCTLVFEGAGGAVGVAKGNAQVILWPGEGCTTLQYESDVQISGKLAQVGARLIDGVARKLSAEFFDRFEAAVMALQE